MRDDVFSILHEIEKHHFHYGLNTNAILIDEQASRRISELTKLFSVVVSLDGSTPAIHDKQRGKGSFDRTVRGIENLLKHNGHVCTYTTVTRNNYQDIEDIPILGKSLGLAAVKFNELLPLGNTICHLPNLKSFQFSEKKRNERDGKVKKCVRKLLSSGQSWKWGIFLKLSKNLINQPMRDVRKE